MGGLVYLVILLLMSYVDSQPCNDNTPKHSDTENPLLDEPSKISHQDLSETTSDEYAINDIVKKSIETSDEYGAGGIGKKSIETKKVLYSSIG